MLWYLAWGSDPLRRRVRVQGVRLGKDTWRQPPHEVPPRHLAQSRFPDPSLVEVGAMAAATSIGEITAKAGEKPRCAYLLARI